MVEAAVEAAVFDASLPSLLPSSSEIVQARKPNQVHSDGTPAWNAHYHQAHHVTASFSRSQDISDVYMIESELRANMDSIFDGVEDIDSLWASRRMKLTSPSGRRSGGEVSCERLRQSPDSYLEEPAKEVAFVGYLYASVCFFVSILKSFPLLQTQTLELTNAGLEISDLPDVRNGH